MPPPRSPLDASVGPFHGTESVQTLLGDTSQQAVTARREAHTIIAVRTADGQWAYPAFQFSGSEVHPALVPAIRTFRDLPAWSTAQWFVTPNPDLDDTSPLDWVLAGRSTDMLVVAAQKTAREWQ